MGRLAPVGLCFPGGILSPYRNGVVADDLMREFSMARASQIGGLASVYFYTYAIMQIPAGVLADFYGPRRTVLLALVTAGIGAIVFGLAKSITDLYIGRFLSSLGVSLIFVNIAKIHAECVSLSDWACSE